ncbi:MAG: apolipoprotein N-acyltransferase, partial [gamma proteobacterium symbiont of Bathyaustriella thionipta]|nr:apolipoprotein N-acyltransferase [gamma proteobacterium symbiont of Bathyaustriella thionipta]
LLVFILGALMPLAFAPFNTRSSLFSYLIFFPVALFLYQLLHTSSAKEAFYKGAVFGVGLFSVGVSWLYVAIHDFGAAHWSLAGIFTGVFILFLSSFYALFALSVFKIRQKKSVSQTQLSLFYLPVLWVLFEWLRSWLLTGFPWILSGYPLIETPLAGFAPVTGIYGLSLLVIFISALLIVRVKPVVSLTSIVLLFIGGALLGQIQWSKAQGESLSVALIQGNVNQTVKWDRWQLEKTKQLYVSLSKDQWQSNDLIVWPENAIPVFYHTLESSFYHHLALQAEKTQTELITGLPFFDDKTQQYYNAMTNLGGEQGYYYKTHLVPFGEYVPLAALIRGIIQFFDMPMSGFSAGDTEQAPLLIKGHKTVITLCYEDVFPQDMMTHIPHSKFMINLSNNGWYGDSFAPHQHFEMARMRALETGRELIRSTTSGISALIDSKGKVMVQGPQFKTAVINGKIQPRTGMTPYVFWGNYPIILLFAVALFLLRKAQNR